MSFDQAGFEEQDAEIRAAFKHKDEEIALLKGKVIEIQIIRCATTPCKMLGC